MSRAGDVRHTLGRILTPWRVAYGAETRRRLAWSVVAVPSALAAAPRALRRPGRVRALTGALLAIPVAIAASALTATLAFLVLVNVLAYPFRPWLGLGGSTEDIWASRYVDSWGGPTLAGAWATHAALILLLGVPILAGVVRGLTGLQWRLTGHPAAPATLSGSPAVLASADHRTEPVADASTGVTRPAGAPSRVCVPPSGTTGGHLIPPTTARPATRTTAPARGSRPPRRSERVRWYRLSAVLAAAALLVTSSLAAHAAGIGDNLLWTPRDAASTIALAITLAPVAALLLLTRTPWWHSVVVVDPRRVGERLPTGWWGGPPRAN